MYLRFVLLTIVATLLATCCSEARSLRQGASTKTTGLASEHDPESEERVFRVRNFESGVITIAESAPVKTSKWDKVLSMLAKKILPGASDYKLVDNNGRWKEHYF
ncbi:secreted RxLR effector peptide protein, putative [Phytophthora infestans T30-4]|uniref:Secreted RxLR effector peptide protein, putative n=1 Tax=Phytophthora infestans (strain T30-4) TaxID=403677 RepID=D0NC64_PHYIT|nr:secreted RxLR effector peptide protein, putative [Phytophthora infestans T30-4]EEY55578.1 secreted RxLR effector peptide protein, putative [Phytophthora infestans T30-4]|eukprot:XP_002903154.1 secreted RxLR effector peptide protein, putative [Phytophthora infestans T30-4]